MINTLEDDVLNSAPVASKSTKVPTTADQKELNNFLKYLTRTRHYRQVIRLTAKMPPMQILDLNSQVDGDWAGCSETRRSTTGFVITLLGATINYSSRPHGTIALSSAEAELAELYAINTGALREHYTYATSSSWHHSTSRR